MGGEVPRPMTAIYELADRYVEAEARLDPCRATLRGLSAGRTEMTDYSPDGIAARDDHTKSTLAELDRLQPVSEDDRLAKAVMAERLGSELELSRSGENLRPLRVIGGAVQLPRQVFDLMPRETEDDWDVIATRLDRVPVTLEGLRKSLDEGLSRNVAAARRQALACAGQAEVWAGSGAQAQSFFARLVEGAAVTDPLRGRLERAAETAASAYGDLGQYLREVYAPRAPERDSSGRERYLILARNCLGVDLDPEDAYGWGWAEVHRLEVAMNEVAAQIDPSASLLEVVELLETDPARSIEGADNLRGWLQNLMDRAVADLDGTHFDIAEPIRRVEAMLATEGGAAAMYYTGPSEDGRTPGRTWYPVRGRSRFPLWGEASIAYHEGVPGHHLQIAVVRVVAQHLSRFQRTMVFVPGYSEGWALYAERLMEELGFLDNPDHKLGMLRAQRFRAARVVADIGMHLELRVPADEDFHPGETWTAELGREFLARHSMFDSDFVASEIDRYLGWPAQAITYKLGERVWLQLRDQVRQLLGRDFVLKDFHSKALNLGPMGLDQLAVELPALFARSEPTTGP